MSAIAENQLRLARIERGVVRLLGRVRKLKALHVNDDGSDEGQLAETCVACGGRGLVFKACCTGRDCGCGGNDVPEPCDCQGLEQQIERYEEGLEALGFPVYGGPF